MSIKSVYLGLAMGGWEREYGQDTQNFAVSLSELLSEKKGRLDKDEQGLIVTKILEKTVGPYPLMTLLDGCLDQDVLEQHFPQIKEKMEALKPRLLLEQLPHYNIHKGYPENDTAVQLVDLLEDTLAKVDAPTALRAVSLVLYRYDGAEEGFQDKAKILYGNVINRILEEKPETAISDIASTFFEINIYSSDYGRALLKEVATQVIIPCVKGYKDAAAHFNMILEKSGIFVEGFSDKFASATGRLRDEWILSIATAERTVTSLEKLLDAAQRDLEEERKLLTNAGLYESFATAVQESRTEGTGTSSTRKKTLPKFDLKGLC